MPNSVPVGFHVMVKPIGPACNLRCEYCFYTEKNALFGSNSDYCMTPETLETFVRSYIEAQDIPEIPFAWQGGEPLLLGVDFFRKVVELQQKYANGKNITNSLQTNGTLLDAEWCRFLADNHFLVGLSLDGPAEIHNIYRVDHNGNPTFDQVIRGLELMQEHSVEFNVLACVTKASSRKPYEVYKFFKKRGVQFIQFIPVVERVAASEGCRLAPPPSSDGSDNTALMPWTVKPEAFGNFMIKVFHEWVHHDVGSIYVMNFEWALASWMGMADVTCVSSSRCGKCVVMEHNGDIYSCDHYVYPEYKLGNILTDDLRGLISSDKQMAFGAAKEITLPQQCLECPALFACRGECPKHRFSKSLSGESGLSYLCAGYEKFYRYIDPYMRGMAQLLRNGQPPSDIMKMIG